MKVDLRRKCRHPLIRSIWLGDIETIPFIRSNFLSAHYRHNWLYFNPTIRRIQSWRNLKFCRWMTIKLRLFCGFITFPSYNCEMTQNGYEHFRWQFKWKLVYTIPAYPCYIISWISFFARTINSIRSALIDVSVYSYPDLLTNYDAQINWRH